jgi:hypothetical protein
MHEQAGPSPNATPSFWSGTAAPAGPEAPHAGRVIRVTAITGPATIIGTITEFGEQSGRRPHAAADNRLT